MKKSIISPGLDLLLIQCPFWVGLLYISATYAFPSARPFIFFIVLSVLGETHFGATGLFFLVRKNRTWLWARRRLLIYVPAVMVCGFISLGLWNLSLALFIGSIASGIHVTRQSIGILRLHGGRRSNVDEWIIYGASFGFLGIGFLRFYAGKAAFLGPVLPLIHILVPLGSIIFCVFLGVSLVVMGLNRAFDRRWLTILTGCLIYAPYCVVSAPQDAIAIGVGMHWCQYLGLTCAVYGRYAVQTGALKKFATAVVVVALYGLAMGAIHTSGGRAFETTSLLVLLPLSGEVIHYYTDAFIWRFSDPHIRDVVGAYIWNTRGSGQAVAATAGAAS